MTQQPLVIELPIESYSTYTEENGVVHYEVVVKATSIPAKGFPLYPNVRVANPNSSISKSFLDTLLFEPDKFFSRSSPLVVSASKVEPVLNKAKADHPIAVKLTLQPTKEDRIGDGLVDGSHRVKTILIANLREWDLSQVRVRIDIVSNIKDADLRKLSTSLNTVHTLDKASQENLLGKFDWFKEQLGEKKKFIRFYSNQDLEPDSGVSRDNRCGFSHVVGLVQVLNLKDHDYRNPNKPTKHPITISHQGGTRRITEPYLYKAKTLFHLFDDAFWIEKQLYENLDYYLHHDHRGGYSQLPGFVNEPSNCGEYVNLCDGSTYPFKMTASLFSYPVIAAFRVFLDDDNQWIAPFMEFAPDLLHHLWKNYLMVLKNQAKPKKQTGEKKIQFYRVIRDKETWHSLFQQALVFKQNYLMTHGELLTDKKTKNEAA